MYYVLFMYIYMCACFIRRRRVNYLCVLSQIADDVFESLLVELQYYSDVASLADDIARVLLSL